MSNIIKILALFCVPIFLWSNTLSFASVGNGEINIEFRGESMSAELKGASLEQVLETLKREKGIWFEAPKSLLEEKVSISFKDLPLEKGMRRILSHINHVLFFNQDNRLVGLFIVGEGKLSMPLAQNPFAAHKEVPPPRPLEHTKARTNPFKIFQNVRTSENPEGTSTDAPIRKGFPIPAELKAEMSATDASNPFLSVENPFAPGISQFPKNPFTGKLFKSPENPFVGKGSQPSENPFTKDNPERDKNPFTEKPFSVQE